MAYKKEDLTKENLKACLEKYEDDNTIFEKAIKMYETYSKGADWPHSVERLNHITEEVIGVEFSLLSNLGREYKGDDEFDWSSVPNKFYKEFIYFYNTVGIQFNKAWHNRFAPEQLESISYTKGFDNIYRLRIVRNDSNYIDLSMSRHDIREMIYNFEQIIKDHDCQEANYVGGK